MAIEQILTELTAALNRNADALEALAAAGGGQAAAPADKPADKPASGGTRSTKPTGGKGGGKAAPKKEDKEEKAAEPTIEEVREVMLGLPKRSDTTELLEEFGVTKLSDVPADKRAELIEKAKAKIEAGSGDDDNDEDDPLA